MTESISGAIASRQAGRDYGSTVAVREAPRFRGHRGREFTVALCDAMAGAFE